MRIEVHGQWPDDCVPRLQRSAIEDAVFKIYTVAGGVKCNKKPTPFHIETTFGHWIYTLTSSSSFYPVEFYVRAQPDAPPQLYAFHVIHAGRNAHTRHVPENGFWWINENDVYGQTGRGSGLSIDRQGDSLIVTLQSYTNNGDPVWYFAEGMLRHGVFQAEYHRITGGSPLYAAGDGPHQISRAGRLILAFDNQRQGTLWMIPEFNRLPHQGIAVFPVPIRRYLTSTRNNATLFQGQWLFSTLDRKNEKMARLFFARGMPGENSHSVVFHTKENTDKAYSLHCQAGFNQDIDHCVLRSVNGKTVALFDDVGVDRLRGTWLADGQAVILIRLD